MKFRASGLAAVGFGEPGFKNLGFRSLGFRSHGFTGPGFTGLGFTDLGFTIRGFAGFGLAAIVVSALTMPVVPAYAHHSFAMFDAEKTKVLEGTVKEFQWTNPHSWILLMVNNAEGQPEQWAIEMGGPGALARQGWVPKTLGPGMKVKAVIHPLRDGNNGGQFMAVTLPDGTLMGNPNAAPSANAGGAGKP